MKQIHSRGQPNIEEPMSQRVLTNTNVELSIVFIVFIALIIFIVVMFLKGDAG